MKWVHAYRVKDRNIWFNVSSEHGAWSWNQNLCPRDKIRSFVAYKLGNGRSCYVWFDKWHNNGPLCKLITHNFLMEQGINMNDKVVDWIDENGWKWPSEWNDLFSEVVNVPVPILTDDCDDKIIWINKENKESEFSVKEAWKALRIDCPKVLWYKHVWFSQCIPRHAFVLRMAMRGRLKTKDRISKWFNITSRLCPLCNNVDETHSHLFFSCRLCGKTLFLYVSLMISLVSGLKLFRVFLLNLPITLYGVLFSVWFLVLRFTTFGKRGTLGFSKMILGLKKLFLKSLWTRLDIDSWV